MTEYAVMLAGMALTVLAGLTFLGGAVGGSWADLVISAPLSNADYGINPHACKKGGWEGMTKADGTTSFANQGDCMQYANTGK
jgi:Flp pilus assembly pilin Flp